MAHAKDAINTQDISGVPLEAIDVSSPELFSSELWRPWFARLRREAPVHYLADSPSGPFWSVTSHKLIKEVDRNNEVFSSEKAGVAIVDSGESAPEVTRGKSFIQMDEPQHAVHRSAVAPVVAPTNLAELQPVIRHHVRDILDNLPVGEGFNWVQHVSKELTARMLATLFGFPYADRHKLVYWSDLATTVPGISGDENIDLAERTDAMTEAASTFYQLWAERVADPSGFDLLSMLIRSEETANMHEDPVLFLGTIFLLIIGGNDTTRNSISASVAALNQYPDEFRKLQNDQSLIPNMVAETIRWQTPVIHMRRTALADIVLGGQQIKAGDKVIMWYLSGNRDEEVFQDADKWIVDRPNARAHVAFGFGVHRCMGNRLAEMQLRVLWEEIMTRFHHIELVGEIDRIPSNFIRGIKELPVVLHPLK